MRIGLAIVLTLVLLGASAGAGAQQTTAVARIGFLAPGGNRAETTEPFLRGLRELGYVEGRNVVTEYRSAEGKADRLPALAAELVALKVDVLVAAGQSAALAARQATRTIPIVLPTAEDPAANGLVASLARPGGYISGLALLSPVLIG